VIEVYEVDAAGKHISDKPVDSWTSKKGEMHDFGPKLENGKSYVLEETVAPTGYGITTATPFQITTDGTLKLGADLAKATSATEKDADGNAKELTGENGEPIYLIEDSALHFVVNKTELGTGTELDGAVLAVFAADEKGEPIGTTPIATWTSKIGETHDFGSDLHINSSYILRETTAPGGYKYAEDINFSVDGEGKVTASVEPVKAGDGTEVYIMEDEKEPAVVTGSVEVTKRLVTEIDGEEEELYADDQTFYVALFEDEGCTTLAGGTKIQALHFVNSKAETTVFAELAPGKTYYLNEVKSLTDPTPIDGGTVKGVAFVAKLSEKKAEISETGGTATVTFTNEFSEIPDGFYRDVALTITKKVLDEKGKAKETDEVFYAGIFEDSTLKKLTERTEEDNIIKLDMDESSEVSVMIKIPQDPNGSYDLYIAEVDKDGEPVSKDKNFGYKATVSKEKIVITTDTTEASVTITNKDKKDPDDSSDRNSGNSGVPGGSGSRGAKTGDDTPVTLWLFMAIASLLVIAGLLLSGRRRRRS
ncbi:MAG: LPXTG cell wall anchor domain-containing protein, partial [Blautia sp.]|nr:LPXTG cell wall anchor domain-containing protein [Blautia sp.]